MATMMQGRAAVVTGAGRGIGRGIAIALAGQGAAVVVGDMGASLAGEGKDTRPAQQVVDQIRSAGGEAIAHHGDVSDFEQGTDLHETGKWPSEMAAGTERDPDNVAPLVVYLCSDASAGVSGQVFASIGYQIVRLEMPRFVRALRGRRRWEPEEVAEWFPRTLGDGG